MSKQKKLIAEPIEEKRFVKTKQRERHVRKGRMKQDRLRAFFRFFLTIGLALGLFNFAKSPQWYMHRDMFNKVDGYSIEILNNRIVPAHKIFAVLKNNKVSELPIYLTRTTEVKRQIKKLTPVENVYIRRYAFPARLQIIVKERIPIITIAPDINVSPVAFFTQDGKLIGKEYLPLSKDINTTLVLSNGNKGDDYKKWDNERLNQIQKIVKYIETYSGEPVEYADFRNPNDIFIKIKTVNIRLGQLDETVYDRIERIPSLLPQVKLVDSKIKYLDISWEKVNYLKLQ